VNLRIPQYRILLQGDFVLIWLKDFDEGVASHFSKFVSNVLHAFRC
jgi:hypothetical protein